MSLETAMRSYYAKKPPSTPPAPRETPAANVRVELQPALALHQPAPTKTHLLEHPLAQQALTALRNKETSHHQFRLLSNQLLVMLMIEATRAVPACDHRVETAAGTHIGQALAKPVLLLTVARHGLGIAHNVADLFPDLHVGVISMDRSSEGLAIEPRLHIANAPAFGDACVILFDPVVANGSSAQAALNLVRRSGATSLTLVSFVCSLPGLSRLQSSLPDLQVWTAAIDAELDPKRGPMPGLGNFAERLYG